MNDERLLRLPDVLHLIPVAKSTWWLGVREGRYPRPVKLGPRCSAWRLSDIRRIVDGGIPGDFVGEGVTGDAA
ncbi:MAG: AlpA family phage regulatory protein [Desulfovibrionaceae bacterium]|uniref:helix-turn-helix transcriptional regulator n=1 Tax=Paucidesulfovibrio longus TaxID=889 RepID=UPI0003F66482|nr:AlpA family phage regulatory protein [Paucidesulfovibrio longus]